MTCRTDAAAPKDPRDLCPDDGAELEGGFMVSHGRRPRRSFVIRCPKCGRLFPELAADLTRAAAPAAERARLRGRNLDADQ